MLFRSISGNAGGNCVTTGVYSVPLVSGMTYNWTAPGTSSILSGQGTNSVVVNFPSGFVSGNLTVNATNGCGTSSNRAIALTSKPSIPGTITGPTTPCIGSTQGYSIASVYGATSYTWTAPTGSTVQSGQGSTSATVLIGNTSGNIAVNASNACGTSSNKTLALTMTACRLDGSGLSEFSISPNPCYSCYVTGVLNENELAVTDILGKIGRAHV